MKRLAFFLSALALTASLAFSGSPPARAADTGSAGTMVVNSRITLKTFVRYYQLQRFGVRKFLGEGWISPGGKWTAPIIIGGTYFIHGEVYDAAGAIIARPIVERNDSVSYTATLEYENNAYVWK